MNSHRRIALYIFLLPLSIRLSVLALTYRGAEKVLYWKNIQIAANLVKGKGYAIDLSSTGYVYFDSQQTKFPVIEIFDNELNEGTTSFGERLDVLLSLNTIPDYLRRTLGSKNCVWIDMEKNGRSVFGNDLEEEVSRFLKPYSGRLSYGND